MDDLTCKQCLRHFQYRDLYLQHEMSCEYFMQNRKRQREKDATEDVPAAEEQFKWIQALALRIGELERQVQRLQHADSTRRRNNVLAWLRNPACPRPTVTATEWFNQVLNVGPGELEKLDEKPLVEVMQDVMSSALQSGSASATPLCAFAGTKTMYVWDKKEGEESMWMPLTVEMWNSYLVKFQHRFRKILNQGGQELLEQEDKDLRERHMQRMRQVNGTVKNLQPWFKKRLETNSPSS
jgi:hypothetical protein